MNYNTKAHDDYGRCRPHDIERAMPPHTLIDQNFVNAIPDDSHDDYGESCRHEIKSAIQPFRPSVMACTMVFITNFRYHTKLSTRMDFVRLVPEVNIETSVSPCIQHDVSHRGANKIGSDNRVYNKRK